MTGRETQTVQPRRPTSRYKRRNYNAGLDWKALAEVQNLITRKSKEALRPSLRSRKHPMTGIWPVS